MLLDAVKSVVGGAPCAPFAKRENLTETQKREQRTYPQLFWKQRKMCPIGVKCVYEKDN